ncbi:MAG: GWxTD domain-containing protein [Gemmatimonadales bacterium]
MKGLALVTTALLWMGGAGTQAEPGVELTAKRFLRGQETLVDGFCRVPFALLAALAPGSGGAYRVEIAVEDSTGLELHRSDWSQSVAPDFLRLGGASTVEHFAFTIPSGHYTVAVAVTDSATGQSQRVATDVRALSAEAHASDLLLSSSMRRATAGSDAAPGEVAKGSLFLTAATTPALTPRQPELSYYLELYPAEDATVSLAARVLGADGSPITATGNEELAVGATGGVAARTLSLAGLPAGTYRLQVISEFPETTVVREAPFVMSGFETETAIAQLAEERQETNAFAELTEDRLDSLYAPLIYIMESDERGVYESLSVEGKRNYLQRFWERRDPTPETARNEMQLAYYALFDEANRRFRESGAGDIPGWRTDRGRIFLKRGEPEEVLQRPQSGETPPYEVWKYSRPRQLKYVFLDETGLGNFALIYTDDRFETGRPDWERLLGPEAVVDVRRF